MPNSSSQQSSSPDALSPSSKRGRDKEEHAALLKVRTGPECPEGSLRELAWDSNPDCGKLIWEKVLTEDTSRQAHRTKDWAELAGCGLAHPPPETGRRGQPEPEGAIEAPERHPIPNCKQTSLLTKTSWDSRWSTSAGRVTAGDQLPRIDTQHTWEGAPIVHPENQVVGKGEGTSCILNWGQLHVPSTWSPELLGPGTGAKRRPNQVCAFVEYLKTWTWVA